ncbi:MAG: alpha/beta hydrolase [Clostridiales bacterium]|nr:alpha/beta hydrolase [Clostridiales bacterium]
MYRLTVVMNIILSFTMLFSGIASQTDLLIHPDKYNAKQLEITDLPEPAVQFETESYVQLSEVRMHYMVYGRDKPPLILVHGNGGSVNSLREAASYLANDFTVYVTESRCHGDSSDPGEITYHLMAKDLKEFIEALGLEKPIVMGHSDGAINAVTLAADYPDVPGAVIACGANSHPKTLKSYFLLGVAARDLFRRDKLNTLMLTLPDFTPEYLSQITCPAYVVSGQFDILWISDTVYIAENISHSDMAILRGENHSSYISQNGKKAYVLVRDWLKTKPELN